MSKKDEKTNVMRVLEQNGIEYEGYMYDSTLNAAEIEKALGQETGSVFKTLVTVGKSGEYYVFMVPAVAELNLKKAAVAAGEKSIEMIPQKQLLPLTGYIHGGCSPIGMKKQFDTFIDETFELFDKICFSGGKPGYHVRISPEDLKKTVKITPADLT